MPTSKRVSRRWVFGAGAAVCVGGAAFAANWFNVLADASAPGAITIEDAHQKAMRGEIYLVDIRRPDEWARTGVAEHAIPIDMRRKDFEDVLQSVLDTSGARPIALICARGVRSDRMDRRLKKAGFVNVVDVPEGMLGSGAGPGWIAKKMPHRAPTEAELAGKVSV